MTVTAICLFLGFQLFCQACVSSSPETVKPSNTSEELMKYSKVCNQVKSISELIRQGRFSEAQRLIDPFLSNRTMTPDGRRALSIVYAMLSKDRSLSSQFDAWCSGADATWSAHIIRGHFRVNEAWRYRGGGYADTVTETGWVRFENMLNLAKADFETAYNKNRSDPNSSSRMITVCMGLSLSRSTMEKWFRRAVTADQLCDRAYTRKWNYLLPKWHGNDTDADEFAEKCYQESPAGSRIYLVKRDHLVEMCGDGCPAGSPEGREIYRLLHRYEKEFPESTVAKNLMADWKMRHKQYSDAIYLYTRSLDLDRLSWTYSYRADVFEKLNDKKKALDDYNQSLILDPTSTELLIKRGKLLSDVRDFDQAIEDFNTAIRIDPEDEEAFRGRAVALSETMQFDRALADANKAIELNPRSSSAYSNRGLIFDDMDKYADALGDFNQAVRMDPENQSAYINRAKLYNTLGSFEMALIDLDKAYELSPGKTAIYNNRAQAYMGLGNYEKAALEMTRALAIYPDRPFYLNNRGLAYSSLGRYDLAEKDFYKALEMDPSNTWTRIWLYSAMLDAGLPGKETLKRLSENLDFTRWPEAIIAFFLDRISDEELVEAAKDLNPVREKQRQCEAFYYLGRYYLSLGDKDRAVDCFGKSVQTMVMRFTEWHEANRELKRMAFNE